MTIQHEGGAVGLKVIKVKGMTIAENLVAFVLVLTALTISGTGFYTAGNFINKGRMYEEASDKAQTLMESGMLDEVAAAFGDNISGGRYNSTAVRNRMSELGYELCGGYYVDRDTMIAVRPYSSDDGDISRPYTDVYCVAANERLYDTESGAVSELDDKLNRIPGIYLYICVPVNPDDVRERVDKQGYTLEQAIGISDYVPLICYAGRWQYVE